MHAPRFSGRLAARPTLPAGLPAGSLLARRLAGAAGALGASAAAAAADVTFASLAGAARGPGSAAVAVALHALCPAPSIPTLRTRTCTLHLVSAQKLSDPPA